MGKDYTRLFDETLETVIGRLKKPSLALAEFTRQFYAKTPLKDIEALDPAILAQMAASAFEFLQDKPAGKPKLRLAEADYAAAISKRGRVVLQILNDDMPFLVDSLMAALSRKGFDVYESIHPILNVRRDAKGTLLDIASGGESGTKGTRAESLIHLHISTPPADMPEGKLLAEVEKVLGNVVASVADWPSMMQKAEALKDAIARLAKGYPQGEIDETADFLDWLTQRNFVFLGYIDYDYTGSGKSLAAEPVGASRLGILKLDKGDQKQKGLAVLSSASKHIVRDSALIEINKTNTKSIVHRPVYMDYIAIKRFDAKGKVVGEARIIGLFTSLAYYQSAEQIPFIRGKINSVLTQAGYDPAGHNGKALRAILEFFPRDELFQMEESALFVTALGILSLEAKPDVGLFTRSDPFERYESCLVYLPRDKFNTYIRQEVATILAEAYHGTVSSYYTQVTNSPLARLQYIIKTPEGRVQPDMKALEKKLSDIINYWIDALRDRLVEQMGDREAERVYREFGNAFPKDYINRYATTTALDDIAKMRLAIETNVAQFHLYVEDDAPEHHFRLKVYSTDVDAALSDMLPTLENMGFAVIDVHPYTMQPTLAGAKKTVVIRDFVVALPHAAHDEAEAIRPLVEEALGQVWHNAVENDGFNALVAAARLGWRAVVLLRAYGKYLKQAGLPYSEATLAGALVANPEVAAQLFNFFATRFDPKGRKNRGTQADAIAESITATLASVTNLTDDRILRRYLATIAATWRTNFYQTGTDGEPKPYVSFKLNSKDVPELPLPRPYAEIFVYSTLTEGIHLRGGKVARGGLRWSDRPEDFRTEILGLMKAQMVKNAVIVPVGSKGGFIVKNPPPSSDRDAFMAAGIACYTQFLHGLLDLTDNIVEGKIVPPADTVRLDGDDPYLVVAADKGTATFSDIANGVSAEYGFWLGDAFASGGSVGYDHKAMGITAKGAWVGVRRHFHEMGVDIQAQDFTVVGIGDMSGDVFGNGMLLSEHIRLAAAFDHRHIFLDPAPDAAISFAERQRLFEKPRSSWAEYDAKLISKGGGVFDRKAKSIPVSKEAQAVLGLAQSSATPDELMRAILKAPVDLLWNGGIGTYVKAESESHDDVGDRANDAIRINGGELRAKVVGEGGNLGFTQKGRIEYALEGGRINTDAIDNSAGVDTSDHEVNIKIGLSKARTEGRLTEKARNAFLATMTDEVAELVLRDNRLQTQALSVALLQGFDLFDAQVSLMHRLERRGLLDRAVEFLPTDKQISLRRSEKRGLTRPELAVLLAYAKMALYHELLASDLPDQPYFEDDLRRYFPAKMAKKFGPDLPYHPLKREIIATVLTNSMINRTGIAFLHGLAEDSGRDMAEIARAYVIARDAFGLRALWAEIEALDGVIPAETQVAMFAEINGFLEHMILWELQHGTQPISFDRITRDFIPRVDAFRKRLPELVSPAITERAGQIAAEYIAGGVAPPLAEKIAGLEALAAAADVAKVARETGRDEAQVGEVYFRVGDRFGLDWLRSLAAHAPAESHWDRLAIKTLIGNLFAAQRHLTLAVEAQAKKSEPADPALTRFLTDHATSLARYERLLLDLKATETRHIPMLVVALQHLEGL